MTTTTKKETTIETANDAVNEMAKAEAKAKAEAEAKAKAEAEAKKAAEEAAKPKMVTVRIPRISKDQEDVFVSVNMDTYLVKRGIPVEVPDFVAEVLEHQEEMLQVAYDFESEKRSD